MTNRRRPEIERVVGLEAIEEVGNGTVTITDKRLWATEDIDLLSRWLTIDREYMVDLEEWR